MIKKFKLFENKQVGRTLSYLLRHDPNFIDNEGWVDIPKVLKKLKISKKDLDTIVNTNDKKRYSYSEDGKKIRANQGHSVKVDVELSEEIPPKYLYHGTSPKNANLIFKNGIKKMNRQYVHLSNDLETAKSVGKRHSKNENPTILQIDSDSMYKDGFKFYLSKNNVWLTDNVPSKYLKINENIITEKKIIHQYIKEFWEFSKNIYGHRKEVKDVTNQLVDFNSQNGYTEERQWVMTTKGDEVYVQDISNGGFTGLDKEGNIVSGSTSDIVRTITKKKVLKEYLQGMSKIGYGTEGEVYSDGKYAYKIIRSDLVPSPKDIKKRFVGKSHPNVIEIYDAWNQKGSSKFPDNEYTIIKMELLDDLPDVEDDDELMRVRDLLWYSQDDFEHIKNIQTTDPQVRKMLNAIIKAKDHVGYLDVGFHNLMYDSKTGEYKQIDIF